MNTVSSKEYKQVAKKHLKKCLPSLVMRGMQIRTTVRYCFTLIRLALMNKIITRIGKNMEKSASSFTAFGNVKWCCHVGSEVAQSCPTLCDPMDGSLPGSSVHGIFQARILEWAAIFFSRGSSQPRD